MGKSTVLSLFEKFGAIIINTDEIVGSLLKKTEVLEKIKGLLGDKAFLEDGSLNTEKVADIVFHNDSLRRSLEDILHPLVFERINLFLDEIADGDKIILVEIPLLFERGYEGRFDKKITVYTEENRFRSYREERHLPEGSTAQIKIPVAGRREDKTFRFYYRQQRRA